MTAALDPELLTLLRSADNSASIAHDFIYGRNGVTKEQADAAIWAIHNALRPLFEDDPEPSGEIDRLRTLIEQAVAELDNSGELIDGTLASLTDVAEESAALRRAVAP